MSLVPKQYILNIRASQNGQPGDDRNAKFKELCQSKGIDVIECINTSEIVPYIESYKPEIIIVEENVLGDEFIYSFNASDYNPYKIIVLDSRDLDRGLEYLNKGADDVLSKEHTVDEIYIRCRAQLRRQEIAELNQRTKLPAINKTFAVIEHCLQKKENWSLIHVDTLNFKGYNAMYGLNKGDIALASIAESITKGINEIDFAGYVGRDNFVVLCNSQNVDEITKKISNNFQEALNKLYKAEDFEKDFIIASAPNRIRRREGLIKLNFGICHSKDRKFFSCSDILEQAIRNKKAYDSENKKILVVEDDNDFAQLLADTFELEGFEATIAKGLDNLIEEIQKIKPRILVLEAASLGPKTFPPLCKQFEPFRKEFGLKVLVATNVPGYEMFLNAGADVYLPKPYDMKTLFNEVRRLRYTHD